ncbi:DUF2428 domain-containing protein [Aphelenchoides besseyi]|nr:DUF2428 domain-containing protein [Aphelenchoides besseyi]
MSDYDGNSWSCASVSSLEDLSFLGRGVEVEWKEACCSDHKCLLTDFALDFVLKHSNESVKVYTHLLQRIISCCRTLKLKIPENRSVQIVKATELLFVNYDEFLSVLGLNVLDQYLPAHTELCFSCQNGDCEHLKFIEETFLDNPSIRRRQKGKIMTLLTQHTKSFHPNKQQLSEQYDLLHRKDDQNSAFQFITHDLELSPGNRDLHLQFLCAALAKEENFMIFKQRLLPMIFKKRHLCCWFMEQIDQIYSNLNLYTKLTISSMLLEKSVNPPASWSSLVSEAELIRSLVDLDENVRLSALHLICCHAKQTAEIKIEDLKLIEAFVYLNSTLNRPVARSDLLSLLKKFFMRIVCYVPVHKRSSLPDDKFVDECGGFLLNLHKFTLDCLCCNGNFNRKLFALQLLELLHTSKLFDGESKGQKFKDLFGLSNAAQSRETYNLLVNMLTDDYELCQTMSLDLLSKIEFDIDNEERDLFIAKVVTESMNTDSKIQHTVFFQMKFVARKFPDQLQSILEALSGECYNRMNNSNLVEITNNTPVYPILSAISAVTSHISLEQREFQAFIRQNVIEMSFKIAQMVEPILHSLSPEGIIITDDGTIVCDDTIKVSDNVVNQLMAQKMESQTLLVSCWRTLKAVSTIFSDLLVRAPSDVLRNQWSDLLPRFYDYFWTNLTVCRHRGAFEIASIGFQAVCDRYAKLFVNEPDHQMNPLNWLEKSVTAACGGVDVHRLCSTRRSAGLPHLIASIIQSYQPTYAHRYHPNPHLDSTITKLSNCRQLEATFEVHCVNVLCALVQSTVFRNQITKHLEPMLLLAFEGIRADTWNVRNAHSQLFSAVVHKIFGTENFNRIGKGMSLTEFSNNFPKAFCEILDILETADVIYGSGEFVVHPALVLLSHLRPTPLDRKSCVLVQHVYRILLTSSRELVRHASIQAIRGFADVNSLLRVLDDDLRSLIRRGKELPSNSMAAFFQLFGHLICNAELSQIGELLHLLESQFLTGEFDLGQLPDYVLVIFFRDFVTAVLDQQLPIDVDRLVQNCRSVVNDPRHRASTALFLATIGRTQALKATAKKTNSQSINLSVVEEIVRNGGELDANAIKSALNDAYERHEILRINEVIALLAQKTSIPLELLADSSCKWSEDSSLDICFLESKLRCNVDYQLTETDWKVLDECEDSIHALEVYHIALSKSEEQKEKLKVRIAAYLQDEYANVREKAAELISPFFHDELLLHVGLCWSLAFERWSEVLERVKEVNCRELIESSALSLSPSSGVFAPCEKNPLAELFCMSQEHLAAKYFMRKLNKST